MKHAPRIEDRPPSFRIEAFGATPIVGSKGCGKIASAKQQAKSFIGLQDGAKRGECLAVAA